MDFLLGVNCALPEICGIEQPGRRRQLKI